MGLPGQTVLVLLYRDSTAAARQMQRCGETSREYFSIRYILWYRIFYRKVWDTLRCMKQLGITSFTFPDIQLSASLSEKRASVVSHDCLNNSNLRCIVVYERHMTQIYTSASSHLWEVADLLHNEQQTNISVVLSVLFCSSSFCRIVRMLEAFAKLWLTAIT